VARPRSGRRFARRRRVDWVQNPETYTHTMTAMTAGASESVAGVLVFPEQAERVGYGGGDPPEDNWLGAARANTRSKQIVRACRGQIEMRPIGTWTGEGVRSWGFRIAKFKYDVNQGQIIVPIVYNMYGNDGIGVEEFTGPYVFADAPFQWERRFNGAFNSNQPDPWWTIPVKWSGRVVLEPDECFAIYVEGDDQFGGASMNFRTWLRSLVEVPD